MKLSRNFKIAVKLADQPAYRLAQLAGVDSHWLSKAINGAIKIQPGDQRVLAIAKVLGLKRSQIFEIQAA